MKNIFFYSLNTQFSNTGDLLINKIFIKLLSQYGNVYLDDIDKPSNFIDSLLTDNVIKLSREEESVESMIKKRTELANRDERLFFVHVPGDISKNGMKKALYNLNFVKNSFFLKKKGVKILRLGISLGNFDFINSVVESISTRNYYAYAVRDSKSFKLGKKFKFANFGKFPDLAWAYEKEGNVISSLEKKNIVLSFRSNITGTSHNVEYIKVIANDIEEIIKQAGLKDESLIITYQVESDKSAAHFLYEFLKEKYDVSLIDDCLSLKKAINVYANSKVVLTNRLHVFMLSMLSNTLSLPYINFSDNKKIWNLMKDNGLEDLVLENTKSNQFNAEVLKGVLNREEYFMQQFSNRRKENSKLIKNYLDKIFSF